MSGIAVRSHYAKTRALIWMAVTLGVLLLTAVNVHLVYVAVTSQPDCVAHARPGEASGTHTFGAAASSCSPMHAIWVNPKTK